MDQVSKVLDEHTGEELWGKLNEKDSFTGAHARRVSLLAEKFALGLGWSSVDVSDLKLAGLLHDIGKLGFSDELFEKLRNGEKLDCADLDVVRRHAGDTEILSFYDSVPAMVLEVLVHHHERYDGSGYPSGIEGANIPLSAKLISILDYFDTVEYQRPCKTPALQKPMGRSEAVKLVIEETHRRFDPELVKQFFRIVLDESA